jgi:hypothetical protein
MSNLQPGVPMTIHSDLARHSVTKQSEYRGCMIQARSYQNRHGKWVPKADIVVGTSRGLQLQAVASTRECAVQAEADARAVLLAQEWIDKES